MIEPGDAAGKKPHDEEGESREMSEDELEGIGGGAGEDPPPPPPPDDESGMGAPPPPP